MVFPIGEMQLLEKRSQVLVAKDAGFGGQVHPTSTKARRIINWGSIDGWDVAALGGSGSVV